MPQSDADGFLLLFVLSEPFQAIFCLVRDFKLLLGLEQLLQILVKLRRHFYPTLLGTQGVVLVEVVDLGYEVSQDGVAIFDHHI